MESDDRTRLWQQFGAAIDMLENAVRACPDALWGDRSREPEFWYVAYHTLFWLDFCLSEAPESFAPPAPYGLEEFDPAGVLPPRVYSKDEMLQYAAHCREKCRARIGALTPPGAARMFEWKSADMSVGERLLYDMRHVQHHTGQLNLLLRQAGITPPGWERRAR